MDNGDADLAWAAKLNLLALDLDLDFDVDLKGQFVQVRAHDADQGVLRQMLIYPPVCKTADSRRCVAPHYG